ncbi:hypothetical protein N9L68_05085 [bacterium]|nr:hypothetical protein [bacterium]
MILKIDGRQKCHINATQVGTVEATLASFQNIASEYVAKMLTEPEFYKRRDELVEEHKPTVGAEANETEQKVDAEANETPTQGMAMKAMKVIKQTKAMKAINASPETSRHTQETSVRKRAGKAAEPSSSPDTPRWRIVSKAQSSVHDFIGEQMDWPF